MYRLGLIGYPIQGSLSPWIHQAFLKKAQRDGEYVRYEISPQQSFTEQIEKIKKSQIKGFNVTVPYKEKIITHLDKIDSSAKKIGAVNTVNFESNQWVGYNTDGIGYVRSLMKQFPQLKTNNQISILLLGAGGAARGIFTGLKQTGFRHIDIANRSLDRARNITAIDPSDSRVLTLKDAETNVRHYELIIQTTSVGMNPNANAQIISLEGMKEGTIVSDIVYQPIETKLLKQAKSLGAQIHYGHTMLLYQAQYAFEIWTGIEVDVGSMDEQLLKLLEGR